MGVQAKGVGVDQEFGVLLREWRLRAGYTQEELAELAALSAHAISMLESGHRLPRLSSVGRLASALELDGPQRRRLASSARPAAFAPIPRMLPPAAQVFTGRSREVDRLLALTVRQAQSSGDPGPVATIDGMAGTGKTALAVHVGHLLAHRFPDGQLFLDLHGFTSDRGPTAPGDALAALLGSLGTGHERIPQDTEERMRLWRGALAERRVLLVLDNAVDGAQVRPLIPAGPGCLVLVTSRRRLPTLAGAVALSLDALEPDEAVELFTRIAGPERVAGHERTAAEIVALCGLLPLAVRIAASRLAHRPSWTPAHLLARLRHRPLDELSVQDQSVHAAFATSYLALPRAQRRFYALAALHTGPAASTARLATLAGTTLSTAEDFLGDLHDHHLLAESTPGHFAFPHLLREFAEERLAEDVSAAERQAAVERAGDRRRSARLR